MWLRSNGRHSAPAYKLNKKHAQAKYLTFQEERKYRFSVNVHLHKVRLYMLF